MAASRLFYSSMLFEQFKIFPKRLKFHFNHCNLFLTYCNHLAVRTQKGETACFFWRRALMDSSYLSTKVPFVTTFKYLLCLRSQVPLYRPNMSLQRVGQKSPLSLKWITVQAIYEYGHILCWLRQVSVIPSVADFRYNPKVWLYYFFSNQFTVGLCR